MDAQTRVEHTLGLAALIQAMVKELAEHFDAGVELLALPLYEMLDENKWLAARHGLDGEVVDLPSDDRVSTKELARRMRWADARARTGPGSADELARSRTCSTGVTAAPGRSSSMRPTTTCARSWRRSSRSRGLTLGRLPVSSFPRERAGPLRHLQELQLRGQPLQRNAPTAASASASAPKIEKEGAEEPRAKRRARPPSLPRLRRDEIPGIAPETRPWAVMGLVTASLLVTLAQSTGELSVLDLGVFGPLDGDPWRLLVTPFVHQNLGYLFITMITVGIFDASRAALRLARADRGLPARGRAPARPCRWRSTCTRRSAPTALRSACCAPGSWMTGARCAAGMTAATT